MMLTCGNRARSVRSLPLVGWALLAGVWAAGGWATSGWAEKPPREATPELGAMELRNGSVLRGDLFVSAGGTHLHWQSPSFDAPFQMRLPAVSAIHFPVSAGAESASSSTTPAWNFELAGGGLLRGELLSFNGEVVRIRPDGLGEPLEIERRLVERMSRPQGDGDVIFPGLRGLEGWTQVDPPGKPTFRDEAGQLVAEGEGVLESTFPLPGQVACDVEVSWRGEPGFTLDVGCSMQGAQRRGGLRIEVVGQTLVAVRELAGDADLAPLQSLEPGSGRLALKLLLTQDPPRLRVYSVAGEPLADLKVQGKTEGPWGIRLINRFGGLLRVERLRVSGWNGEAPQEVQSAKTRLHRANGEIVYGGIDSLADGQVAVTVDGTTSMIPLTEVSTLVLNGSSGTASEGLAVATFDGSRLTGTLLGVDDSAVTLAVAGITPSVRIPRKQLRTMLIPESLKEESPPPGGRTGTLQLVNQFIQGWLVDSDSSTGSSRLKFQPAGSDSSAGLLPAESGRMVYAEPPKPQPRTEEQQRNRRLGGVRVVPAPGLGGAAIDALQALTGRFSAPKPISKPLLHLRTGDTITCETVGVDEQGVSLTSPSTEARHVPHERVKLVELVPGKPEDVKLAKARKERLLTLPRMQRPSPPTQLVRSTSGDFLRGRVTSLDKDRLKLEVRLDNREVPRDLVSHIFWLHPDELAAEAAANPQAAPSVQRVQAHRHDGFRLTFVLRQLQGGVLTGDSDVLGVCRAEIENMDELIIGGGIEQAVAQLAYHRWRLRNAPDPKFVNDDGGPDGGAGGGAESPLVGKPAPDFKLALLTGGEFQLAAQKGKITVLDFFATWCGPCVKAMPLVEQAVHSFPPEKVQLVAVNLQEQPKQIEALLNRHQLDVTVVLDVDGVVAEKYQASAIPQTVIVDAEGNVAKLYVGGGPDLGEQIKQAVQELLDAPPK